jgi:hypothetical protein
LPRALHECRRPRAIRVGYRAARARQRDFHRIINRSQLVIDVAWWGAEDKELLGLIL